MKFIIGKNHDQVELFCLEDAIYCENEVRLIDFHYTR